MDNWSDDPLMDVSLAEWWDDSEYALNHYVGKPPDSALIVSIETDLDVRPPRSYLAMMRRHHGGLPRFTCFPTSTRTTWADDHVAITGIFGLSRERESSLCGTAGNQFWNRIHGRQGRYGPRRADTT